MMGLYKKRPYKGKTWKVLLNKGKSEGCQTFSHSPKYVPATFSINLEPKLMQVNFLEVKPLPSGSHGDISVPAQKLIQTIQRGVGNMPKPLAGGCELLITHQEISGSEEDHRMLRRMEPIFFKGQDQQDRDLVGCSKSFICRQ
ncbi:hypothetical protein O181_129786 [Austropuccinia psidii MF-1]|uniref:Uncharacterized protein n=1 Tax=Austropuccinia psidii MF-1 TaxID=1389203 RepID=A0A9Q3L0R6_9BASI|nr:hypothetical protein [Austropuccinia psidii MF-1]